MCKASLFVNNADSPTVREPLDRVNPDHVRDLIPFLDETNHVIGFT
jgi:hypothetical protein